MGSRAAVLMRAPARNATRGPAASLLTRTRPPAIVRAAANPTHGAAPRRAATIPARHGAAGSHIVLQRKLAIGTVNDPLEREADRVAEQVIRMPAPAPVSRASSLQINRKCAECEEEEEKGKLQKKSAGRAAPQTAPPIVHEVLAEPGAPLDAATRAFMEPRFDYDFSRVRVHSGAAATRSAQAVNALAYTVGDRIVLGSAGAGPHLLAHELAHVVQQGSSSTGLRSAQMRRKETTPAPEVKVDPTATCNLEQHRKIEPAAYKADEWLSVAIPALEALVAGARTPAAAKASAALGKHFHSTEQAVATYVIARLKTIQRDLFTRQPFRINCPPASDAACHQNEAFVERDQSVLAVFRTRRARSRQHDHPRVRTHAARSARRSEAGRSRIQVRRVLLLSDDGPGTDQRGVLRDAGARDCHRLDARPGLHRRYAL